MFRYTQSLLYVLPTLSLVAGVSGSTIMDSDNVIQLTGSTFEQSISQHQLTFATFYAPWCQYCQELAPEFIEAATVLDASANTNVTFAQINCDEEKELCTEQEIATYPTLKLFKTVEDVQTYHGERERSSMASFIRKQTSPPMTTLTSAEELEAFERIDRVVVIAYPGQGSHKDHEKEEESWTSHLQLFAESMTDQPFYRFGMYLSQGDAENTQEPARLVLRRQLDSHTSVYPHALSSATPGWQIAQWIVRESQPLMELARPRDWNWYLGTNLPMAFVFASSPQQEDVLLESLASIAERVQGHLFVRVVASQDAAHFAQRFDIEPREVKAKGGQGAVIAMKDMESEDPAVVDKLLDVGQEGIIAAMEKFLGEGITVSDEEEDRAVHNEL